MWVLVDENKAYKWFEFSEEMIIMFSLIYTIILHKRVECTMLIMINEKKITEFQKKQTEDSCSLEGI